MLQCRRCRFADCECLAAIFARYSRRLTFFIIALPARRRAAAHTAVTAAGVSRRSPHRGRHRRHTDLASRGYFFGYARRFTKSGISLGVDESAIRYLRNESVILRCVEVRHRRCHAFASEELASSKSRLRRCYFGHRSRRASGARRTVSRRRV